MVDWANVAMHNGDDDKKQRQATKDQPEEKLAKPAQDKKVEKSPEDKNIDTVAGNIEREEENKRKKAAEQSKLREAAKELDLQKFNYEKLFEQHQNELRNSWITTNLFLVAILAGLVPILLNYSELLPYIRTILLLIITVFIFGWMVIVERVAYHNRCIEDKLKELEVVFSHKTRGVKFEVYDLCFILKPDGFFQKTANKIDIRSVYRIFAFLLLLLFLLSVSIDYCPYFRNLIGIDKITAAQVTEKPTVERVAGNLVIEEKKEAITPAEKLNDIGENKTVIPEADTTKESNSVEQINTDEE